MPLEPIVKSSLSDSVFQQLSAQILTGELAAGEVLASERALTEVFGVNRQAVREALKRMQQAGLIRISQGDATTVLDYRQTAGLDLLPLLAAHATTADVATLELVRASMEMRQCIGADAASMCAERAIEPIPGRLLDLVAAMEAAPLDPLRLGPLSVSFWEVLVDGSGNVAYRLALNTLNAAARPQQGLAYVLLTDELADRVAYRELATAIAASDPHKALRTAHKLLGKGVHAITELANQARLGQLERTV